MNLKGSNGVGRFSIQFEVANNDDMVQARTGAMRRQDVRRATITGVVDSGATRLVLPRAVAKQLGLPIAGKSKVRYADGRRATRSKVKNVYVEILGRDGVFTAAIEPKRTTALIGAIVLEDLDFVVDCTGQRLIPRDPHFIVSEIG